MERLKEALIAVRLRAGEEAAFVQTYEFFGPKIYRHALFRVSSPETAEDIMHETFARAWEFARERAAEIRSLRAFLYRIADNLIVDHYRRNAKAALPMTEELEATLSDGRDPLAAIDGALARERMREALAKLREEARSLLVMRYIDELSIGEIAELTGKKKNAVYVALHRAVKELQRLCVS